MVLGNLRAHRAAIMNDELWPYGNQYTFLPPYSPMLNPCEEAFNVLKHRIKMAMAARVEELVAVESLPWGQKKTAQRQTSLFDIIQNSMAVITANKAKPGGSTPCLLSQSAGHGEHLDGGQKSPATSPLVPLETSP